MKSAIWVLFFTFLTANTFGATPIRIIDPTLFQEVPEEEREYQDCQVAGAAYTCPAGSPEGYKCLPTRSEDIFEDGADELQGIRKFILGIQDADESKNGRVSGTCSEQIPGYLPMIVSSITMYRADPQTGDVVVPVTPNVNISEPTPQTEHPKIFEPTQSMQTLNLGCASNRCVKDESLPVPIPGTPDYNRYSQYQCQPRYTCRCIEENEAIGTTGGTCCEGLTVINGKCEPDNMDIAFQSALEDMPDHVNPASGIFEIAEDSPALTSLMFNTIKMKALEWFAYNQENNKKCLPDHEALRKIGRELVTERMKKITQEYNEDFSKLQELKQKYLLYSQQLIDPKKFFAQQGAITYRGQNMTAEQFEAFVRNSTSGAEIFNLMADEQAIQLRYEFKVAKLMKELAAVDENKNLDMMKNEYASLRGGDKINDRRIFGGIRFGCRRKVLGFRRRNKKRWRSRYSVVRFPFVSGDNDRNYASFRRAEDDPNMMFFEGLMNTTLLGQTIFNKGKSRRSFDLIEPLVASGMGKNYHSFGDHRSTFWSNQQPHRLTTVNGLESIKDHFRESIANYFKTQYFDEGHEIVDVAFGGLRVCIDSTEENPFQIKTVQACERYKRAMDYLVEAGYALFLQASYGGRQLYTSTFRSKARFMNSMQQSATELEALYTHLSAIPEIFGGEITLLDQSGLDYETMFNQINENSSHPGYLRLKSYLFFKAKAKSLAENTAETSIATGNVPQLGNLYGTPAILLNPGQLPQTSSQNLRVGTAELRKSNSAAAQAARDARNREDFLSINKNASGSIAGSDPSRRLSKLNQQARDFKKRNPSAKDAIAKAEVAASNANKKISSALNSGLNSQSAQAVANSLQQLKTQELSEKKGDKDSKKVANTRVVSEGFAPNLQGYGDQNTSALYKEASSSSDGYNKQLTGLSDTELRRAIENVENQPHLFRTEVDDTLFSKISKTYARSYDRFLVKKRKNNSQSSQLETKKRSKVRRLLNDI